jgi:hypothetical protein
MLSGVWDISWDTEIAPMPKPRVAKLENATARRKLPVQDHVHRATRLSSSLIWGLVVIISRKLLSFKKSSS